MNYGNVETIIVNWFCRHDDRDYLTSPYDIPLYAHRKMSINIQFDQQQYLRQDTQYLWKATTILLFLDRFFFYITVVSRVTSSTSVYHRNCDILISYRRRGWTQKCIMSTSWRNLSKHQVVRSTCSRPIIHYMEVFFFFFREGWNGQMNPVVVLK